MDPRAEWQVLGPAISREGVGVHKGYAADVVVEEVTATRGHALFEALCQDELGIGREEFLRRLDWGHYDDSDLDVIMKLAVMAPFAR